MTSVIILCGGKGRRLKKMTSLPKPLVELSGKPVIAHTIEFYIKKGLRDFTLCAGYKADAIEDFVREQNFAAGINISNAGANAGMLKRIYACRKFIGERAIVTYGDTFINIDPQKILAEHIKSKAPATITIADIRSPFGLVKFDSDMRVVSFDEKPVLEYYIGHMVLEKGLINSFDKDFIDMPDGTGLVAEFNKLIKQKRLNAYRHRGLNITFNTPYEHSKAEQEFIKFFTRQEG